MNQHTGTGRGPGEDEASLRQRLAGRVSGLCVVRREECVILRGYARTYYGKQLAQHAAMQLFGPYVLVNEIEVRPLPPPGRPADTDPDGPSAAD